MKSQVELLTKEKDQMLQALKNNQGTDSAFDRFQFKRIGDENKILLKQIEDLKFELLCEKNLNQEKLLEKEELVSRLAELLQENNKLQSTKSELMVQFSSQQQLYELKLKLLEESKVFYQQDIEYMKLKQENMIKGISCLKSYMYDSLTAEQKLENEQKLAHIDSVVSSLNDNIERNTNQHKVRLTLTQNQIVEKLTNLSGLIEESVSKLRQDGIEATDSKLKYSAKIAEFEREVESLKKTNENLGSENQKQLKQIQSQQATLSNQHDPSHPEIDLERITNALQKGLDLISVIGNR